MESSCKNLSFINNSTEQGNEEKNRLFESLSLSLSLSLILTPEAVTSVSATGPELVKIGCPELGHVVTRVAARALAEGEVPVGVEASWERHRVVGGEETLLKQDLSNEMCLQCVYEDYAGFDPRNCPRQNHIYEFNLLHR